MKTLTFLLMLFAVNSICQAQKIADKYGLLKSSGPQFDTYVLIVKSDTRDSQRAETIYEFSFDKNQENPNPVSSGAGLYQRIHGDFRNLDILWDTQNSSWIREKAKIKRIDGKLSMRIVKSNSPGRVNGTFSKVSGNKLESRVQNFVKRLLKERPIAFAEELKPIQGPMYWDIVFQIIEDRGKVNSAMTRILNDK